MVERGEEPFGRLLDHGLLSGATPPAMYTTNNCNTSLLLPALQMFSSFIDQLVSRDQERLSSLYSALAPAHPESRRILARVLPIGRSHVAVATSSSRPPIVYSLLPGTLTCRQVRGRVMVVRLFVWLLVFLRAKTDFSRQCHFQVPFTTDRWPDAIGATFFIQWHCVVFQTLVPG